LAGDAVEASCEHALFASADVAAAAVSYTASQLSRLAPLDQPIAQTAEQQSLRKALERDRYGLVAQVLAARDGCTADECDAFRLFSDPSQIQANMRDHAYDATINRYAAAWASGPSAASSVAGASVPTGKPSTIDFPSSASIPPVNIMTSEPPTGTAAAVPAAPKPPSPATANAQAAPPHPAKKPATNAAAVPKPRPLHPPKPLTVSPPAQTAGD
jgi:hypothetical protein